MPRQYVQNVKRTADDDGAVAAGGGRGTRVGQWAVLAVALLVGCQSEKPQMLSSATVYTWHYKSEHGWKFSSPHYTIYTTVIDEDVRTVLPILMEGAFAEYRKLVPTVDVSERPMDCYLFQSRGEWNEFTRDLTGKDSEVYLQIRRGGYTLGDRFVAYYIGLNATASIASHEGWHQFASRNFRGRLPPFLEEGLATTFEGVTWRDNVPHWNASINPLRAQSLRRSVEHRQLWPLERLISLHAGEVVNQSGERIEAFYAQCWAFAKFLREGEGGRFRPALQKWLMETADGTVYDPSHTHNRAGLPWNRKAVKPMVEHYLGMPLNDVDELFHNYMTKVAYQDYSAQWELPE